MVMRQTPFTCGQPGTEVIGDRVPLRPPPLSLHLPSVLHLRGLLPLPTPSHARSQQPLDTRGFLWTSLMSCCVTWSVPCCPLGSVSLWLVSGELGFLEILTRELGALTGNTLLVAICPFSPGLGFKVPSLLLTPWPPTPVPTTPLLSPSPSNPNPLLSPPS